MSPDAKALESVLATMMIGWDIGLVLALLGLFGIPAILESVSDYRYRQKHKGERVTTMMDVNNAVLNCNENYKKLRERIEAEWQQQVDAQEKADLEAQFPALKSEVKRDARIDDAVSETFH